jgi:hypothetical protein
LALEGVRKTYRARYYNPTTGRFLSEDPAGFGGSGTNLYAYVGNSPINFIDPFGLGILPTNPSGLGPQWQPDPSHLDPNGSRWVNPDGDYLDFHPGRPGMPGWRGKDHWHNNGCKKHLAPGDELPEETTAPVPAPEPEPEPEPSTGPSEPGPLQQVINWAEAHPGVVIAGAVVVGGTVIILTGGAGALILAPAL